MSIIREIISMLQNMTIEGDFVPLLGIPEMQMIGFDISADDRSMGMFVSHTIIYVLRRYCLPSDKTVIRSI